MMKAARASNLRDKYPAYKKPFFNCRGKRFFAKDQPISMQHLRQFGINPRFFRQGGNIYTLSPDKYTLFRETWGFDETNEGAYPLAKVGDNQDLYSKKISRLPDRSRIMALPKNHDQRALFHEISHDIFIGGGLPLETRNSFIRLISDLLRAKPDDPFLQNIFSLSKFNLIFELNDYKKLVTFVGECFVYSAEYYFGHSSENENGKPPEEIIDFFDGIKLAA